MPRPPADFPYGPDVPLTRADAERLGLSWRATGFGGIQTPTLGTRVSADTSISLVVVARALQMRDPDIAISHHSGLEVIGAVVPPRLRWLPPDREGLEFVPRRTGVHPADPGRIARFLPDADRSRVFVTAPGPRSNGRTRDSRRFRSDAMETVWAEGVQVLRPGRLCCGVADEVSEYELVQSIDSLTGPWTGNRFSIEEIAEELDDLGGLRGVRAARQALARADPRSASPPETLLRLLILDSGLPEPELNVEVCSKRTHGQTVIVDIFFRAARLVVEYEGRQHLTNPRQWDLDISRGQLLVELGLRHLRVNNSHLRAPARLMHRIGALVADPSRPV